MTIDIAPLGACLERLRYVVEGDEVRSSDLNDKTECLRVIRDIITNIAGALSGIPDPPIEDLINEFDAVLSQIRHVASGDVILPEDHNYVVDALKKLRDILDEIIKRLMPFAMAQISLAPTAVPPTDIRTIDTNLVRPQPIEGRIADTQGQNDIQIRVSVEINVG